MGTASQCRRRTESICLDAVQVLENGSIYYSYGKFKDRELAIIAENDSVIKSPVSPEIITNISLATDLVSIPTAANFERASCHNPLFPTAFRLTCYEAYSVTPRGGNDHAAIEAIYFRI